MRTKMKQKLTDKRGETLSETLSALLVIGLSAVLLFTMTGAAARLARKANAESRKMYKKISAIEGYTASGESVLETETVSGAEVKINGEPPVPVKGYKVKVSDGSTFFRYEPKKEDAHANQTEE